MEALPVEVIRAFLFLRLSASDIVRFRLINRLWNTIYRQEFPLNPLVQAVPVVVQLPPPPPLVPDPPVQEAFPQEPLPQVALPHNQLPLSALQPTRGGAECSGFLLENDHLNEAATAGLQPSRLFALLDDAFPGRMPRIVASSNGSGFLCVILRNPSELTVYAPMVNQRVVIQPPFYPPPDLSFLGLLADVDDGVEVCPRFTLVYPYSPLPRNTDNLVRAFRLRTWNSINKVWVTHAFHAVLVDYSPIGTVNIRETVYFQVSLTEIVSYTVNPRGEDGDGVCQLFNTPEELLGLENTVMQL